MLLSYKPSGEYVRRMHRSLVDAGSRPAATGKLWEPPVDCSAAAPLATCPGHAMEEP